MASRRRATPRRLQGVRLHCAGPQPDGHAGVLHAQDHVGAAGTHPSGRFAVRVRVRAPPVTTAERQAEKKKKDLEQVLSIAKEEAIVIKSLN